MQSVLCVMCRAILWCEVVGQPVVVKSILYSLYCYNSSFCVASRVQSHVCNFCFGLLIFWWLTPHVDKILFKTLVIDLRVGGPPSLPHRKTSVLI